MEEVNIYEPVVGRVKPEKRELTLENLHPVPIAVTAEHGGQLVAKLKFPVVYFSHYV